MSNNSGNIEKPSTQTEKKGKEIPVALIAFAGTILAALIVISPRIFDEYPKTPTPDSPVTYTQTITPIINSIETTSTSTPTLPQNTILGKPVGDINTFYVYPDYSPSGWMGDIGDLFILEKGPDGVKFKYEVCGQPPREDDNKYINSVLNPEPAKFAGVMYLNPPNNWGTNSEGGFDLRGFNRITWEARSLQGKVNVEFIIGGVNWIWNNENEKQSAPFPDSMPRDSLGIKTLGESWQIFSESLTNHSMADFQNVVGGFAWVISWEDEIAVDNPGTCPPEPKVFTIEIRNIRYEK